MARFIDAATQRPVAIWNADLLCHHTAGTIIGEAIVLRTGSSVTHIGLAVQTNLISAWGPGREPIPMDVGALGGGVFPVPIENEIAMGSLISVLRLTPAAEQAMELRSDDWRAAIARHALWCCGRIHYDDAGLLEQLLPRWPLIEAALGNRDTDLDTATRVICGELASAEYRERAIDLVPDHVDQATWPADLWRSPLLMVVAQQLAIETGDTRGNP